MKKRISLVLTAVALATLMIVGGTLAWFTDKEDITNHLSTGKVDILLEEPNFNCSTSQNVFPGDVISKDPTITNNSTREVYVRVKITPNGNITTVRPDQVAGCFDIVSADWELVGDYYYYKEAVKIGGANKVTLFRHVTIPTTMGNADMEKVINIKVEAESIQARQTGVTPVNAFLETDGITPIVIVKK